MSAPRALWAVALTSLALNLVTITALGLAWRRAQSLQGDLIAAVERMPLKPVSLAMSVHVDQRLPLKMSVPFRDTLDVPLDFALPLETTVTVPFEIPMSKRTVDVRVPIRSVVPVKGTLPVPIDRDFRIDTEVPVVMDVPVQVEVDLGLFRAAVLDAMRAPP